MGGRPRQSNCPGYKSVSRALFPPAPFLERLGTVCLCSCSLFLEIKPEKLGNGSWSGSGAQNLLSEENFKFFLLKMFSPSLPSQYSGFLTSRSPCFSASVGLVYPEAFLTSSLPLPEFFYGEERRRERARGKVPDCSPIPFSSSNWVPTNQWLLSLCSILPSLCPHSVLGPHT